MNTYFSRTESHVQLDRVAAIVKEYKSIFLMAKGNCYEIAREGMIKMIEGAYIHAHAIPAGDLKHYAITLMEKGTGVICLCPEDNTWKYMCNAIHEVKARGAKVFGVSSQPNLLFDYHIPVPKKSDLSEVFYVLVLQLLAYKVSLLLGHSVDKPRHIAKSVTVI